MKPREGRKKSFIQKVLGEKQKEPVTKKEDFFYSEDIGESPVLPRTNVSRTFKGFQDKHSSSFPRCSDTQPLRIFVATWNVGGKAPCSDFVLHDFLPCDDQSDIYVLGFQEIVPLNAGNVFVIEDNEPAVMWLSLINRALNRKLDSNGSISIPISTHSSPHSCPTSGGSKFFHKTSLKSLKRSYRAVQGRQLKSCNCPPELSKAGPAMDLCLRLQAQFKATDSSEEEKEEEPTSSISSDIFSTSTIKQRLSLVACKQMVGIFVTIWVRRELVHHVGHLRISCVGRGILGRLGNKGCISVSMSLYQTSFCFICSHLASGEKEGDELRRNSDVVEILKSTQFPRICRASNRRVPYKILEHDRVIWFGDLNYRIALSYSEAKLLLVHNNWDPLLEKDQLKIEREAGRVFKGWKEGKIYFAPTYKYLSDSDAYAGESVKSVKKRRTPAWCDRILWRGDGIAQLSYIRGESRFSDHRPVISVFVVEVQKLETRKLS